MESFYGGRRGSGLDIRATYDTVEAMAAAFNSVSCPINYGEYVMVDGPDISNTVYKRTMGAPGYMRISLLKETVIGSGTELTATAHPIPNFDGKSENINIGITSLNNGNRVINQFDIDFPYSVVEIEGATRIDDGSHPFYRKFKLPTLENEISGGKFENLRIVTVDENTTNIYNSNNTAYYVAGNIGKTILVYTYNDSLGSKDYYIGDINNVNNISVNNGKITITYTCAPMRLFTLPAGIEEVDLTDGVLTFSLSDNTEKTAELNYVTNLSYDEVNKTLNLVWADNTFSSVVEEVKFIDDIKIENDKLQVKYQGDNNYTELGTVGINQGIVFLKSYSYDTLFEDPRPETATSVEIIARLNTLYPTGCDNKVIAYSQIADGAKTIYGFDTTNHEWFYVGSFSIPRISTVMIGQSNITNEATWAAAVANSTWYITEEIEIQ